MLVYEGIKSGFIDDVDLGKIADKIRTYVEVELGKEVEEIVDIEDDEDSIRPVYDELTHPEMDLDAVILTALKNCNADDPDLQKELEDSSLAEVVYPNLKELSVEELKAIMEHHREFKNMDNSLYPSEWPADKFGPYPAKLAEALVLTKDNESLTDLFNIFYAHRQISEKAAHVFMKDVIDDPTGANKQLIANSKDFDADYVTDMLDDIASKYPQFVEDAKKKYNL